MALIFPTTGNAAEVCGADPRVCAGRPRPASGTTGSASCRVRQADEASAAGEGARPTIHAECRDAKSEWHWVFSLPALLSPQQFAVEGRLRAGDGVPTVIALHAGAGGGSDAGA